MLATVDHRSNVWGHGAADLPAILGTPWYSPTLCCAADTIKFGVAESVYAGGLRVADCGGSFVARKHGGCAWQADQMPTSA